MKVTRLTILLALLLAGCGGSALEVQQADDIPAGPGIFTRGDGAAVLYSSDRDKSQEVSEPSAEEHGTVDSEDEFEQFKSWQKWKTAPDSAEERTEFEQWQEYQKYKKSKQGQ